MQGFPPEVESGGSEPMNTGEHSALFEEGNKIQSYIRYLSIIFYDIYF